MSQSTQSYRVLFMWFYLLFILDPIYLKVHASSRKSANIFSIAVRIFRSLYVKTFLLCLFSIHNTISLSRHEQVRLRKLRFERYFSHHRAVGEVSLET